MNCNTTHYRANSSSVPGDPTWPCISSHFGILDTCGFPKDPFYYYRAWWSGEPVLHLFPHWNWDGREGQDIDVWCFTNLDRVELFVNGTRAGVRDVQKHSHVSWKVPYRAGWIEARGTSNGKPLVSRRETTGAANGIRLVADRARLNADGEDVAVVRAEVIDSTGRLVPTAGHLIQFSVNGNARIIGVGNGDPSSHEADRATQRSAFNGLCMALVQTTKDAGGIQISASAPGLSPASITLTSTPGIRRAAL